jgi:plasmid stabilization system protein ParE
LKVIFHPAARAEHLNQVGYYEAQAKGLGVRYQSAVKSALEVILEAPHRHPVVCAPEVRRFAVKRYPFAAFYRQLPSALHVLAIAPHRKAPGYWRGRI